MDKREKEVFQITLYMALKAWGEGLSTEETDDAFAVMKRLCYNNDKEKEVSGKVLCDTFDRVVREKLYIQQGA